jgi:hypothetical protein
MMAAAVARRLLRPHLLHLPHLLLLLLPSRWRAAVATRGALLPWCGAQVASDPRAVSSLCSPQEHAPQRQFPDKSGRVHSANRGGNGRAPALGHL